MKTRLYTHTVSFLGEDDVEVIHDELGEIREVYQFSQTFTANNGFAKLELDWLREHEADRLEIIQREIDAKIDFQKKDGPRKTDPFVEFLKDLCINPYGKKVP